jgi:hypothetical protein
MVLALVANTIYNLLTRLLTYWSTTCVMDPTGAGSLQWIGGATLVAGVAAIWRLTIDSRAVGVFLLSLTSLLFLLTVVRLGGRQTRTGDLRRLAMMLGVLPVMTAGEIVWQWQERDMGVRHTCTIVNLLLVASVWLGLVTCRPVIKSVRVYGASSIGKHLRGRRDGVAIVALVAALSLMMKQTMWMDHCWVYCWVLSYFAVDCLRLMLVGD